MRLFIFKICENLENMNCRIARLECTIDPNSVCKNKQHDDTGYECPHVIL